MTLVVTRQGESWLRQQPNPGPGPRRGRALWRSRYLAAGDSFGSTGPISKEAGLSADLAGERPEGLVEEDAQQHARHSWPASRVGSPVEATKSWNSRPVAQERRATAVANDTGVSGNRRRRPLTTPIQAGVVAAAAIAGRLSPTKSRSRAYPDQTEPVQDPAPILVAAQKEGRFDEPGFPRAIPRGRRSTRDSTAYRAPMSEGWDPASEGVLALPSGRLVRGRGLRAPLP